MEKYQVFNGVSYRKDTPEKVIKILDSVISKRIVRLKFQFGNPETGEVWPQEYDTIGYIGKTTGNIKIPILIHNKRSLGGGALMENRILRISTSIGNAVIYQSDNYKQPIVEIKQVDNAEYPYQTIYNGDLHGQHKTLRSAELCRNKLI